MRHVIFSIVALSNLFYASLTGATTLIDMYGDKDGFGLGVTENSPFEYDAVVASGDEGYTDQWVFGTNTYEHTIDFSLFSSPLTSAYLEIFAGGVGWYDVDYGQAKIQVNGQDFGLLTDGDFTEPYVSPADNGNYARRDVIDLMSLSLADFSSGLLTVSIVVGSEDDGWVLDYSKLYISDDPAPVPEPATMILFGTGIAGLAGMRGFKRTRKGEVKG